MGKLQRRLNVPTLFLILTAVLLYRLNSAQAEIRRCLQGHPHQWQDRSHHELVVQPQLRLHLHRQVRRKSRAPAQSAQRTLDLCRL